MSCRIRHRWTRWFFVVAEDPWNGCVQTLTNRVWRMCRRCGTQQEEEADPSPPPLWRVRVL